MNLPHAREGEDECLYRQASPVDDEIRLADLLRVLQQGLRIIASVTVVVTLVTALVALWLPDQYAVTAKLSAGTQAQALAEAVEGSDVYMRIIRQTQLKKLGLPDEESVRRAFGKMTRLSVNKKNGLLEFEVTYADRAVAVQMADALLPYASELASERLITAQAQVRRSLELQLEDGKKALLDLEQRAPQVRARFTPDQLFNIQLVGDLRAEMVALSPADSQNLRQSAILPLQELMNGVDHSGASRSSKAATAVGGAEAQKLLQDLAFQRSLNVRIERQLRLASAQEKEDIRAVAPAVPPQEKASPKRMLIVSLAFLAALFASVLLVFMRENLKGQTSQRRQGESAG